jgi:hypothetical protein
LQSHSFTFSALLSNKIEQVVGNRNVIFGKLKLNSDYSIILAIYLQSGAVTSTADIPLALCMSVYKRHESIFAIRNITENRHTKMAKGILFHGNDTNAKNN